MKDKILKLLFPFLIGLLLGFIITYAMSNKYVSYASKGWKIVRVNKWTGKTEISDTRNAKPIWIEVK